jgi:hypothetical protein
MTQGASGIQNAAIPTASWQETSGWRLILNPLQIFVTMHINTFLSIVTIASLPLAEAIVGKTYTNWDWYVTENQCTHVRRETYFVTVANRLAHGPTIFLRALRTWETQLHAVLCFR